MALTMANRLIRAAAALHKLLFLHFVSLTFKKRASHEACFGEQLLHAKFAQRGLGPA
jgi:hypothetical protein